VKEVVQEELYTGWDSRRSDIREMCWMLYDQDRPAGCTPATLDIIAFK